MTFEVMMELILYLIIAGLLLIGHPLSRAVLIDIYERATNKDTHICNKCKNDPTVTPGTCECRVHKDVNRGRAAKTTRSNKKE